MIKRVQKRVRPVKASKTVQKQIQTMVCVPGDKCRQCGAKAPLLELLNTGWGKKRPIDLKRALVCNKCRALNDRVRALLLPRIRTVSQMEVQ
jgi:hypothetical protein